MRGRQAGRARGCVPGPMLVLGHGKQQREATKTEMRASLEMIAFRSAETECAVFCLSTRARFTDYLTDVTFQKTGRRAGGKRFLVVRAERLVYRRVRARIAPTPARHTRARVGLSTRRVPSSRVVLPRRRSPAPVSARNVLASVSFSASDLPPRPCRRSHLARSASPPPRSASSPSRAAPSRRRMSPRPPTPISSCTRYASPLEIRSARIARVTRVRSRRPRLVARRAPEMRAAPDQPPFPTPAPRSPSPRISSSSART